MPSSDLSGAQTRPIVRPAREDETERMLSIINTAAEAYRGVIPADCWHEPYMSAAELRAEIAAGVTFVVAEIDGAVLGLMGIQSVRDVDLIRHAYVMPGCQKRGVGGLLLAHLREKTTRPILVGTWAAATWAIGFYERHGFQLVASHTTALLLRTYWTVSERQIESSVVLALVGTVPVATVVGY